VLCFWFTVIAIGQGFVDCLSCGWLVAATVADVMVCFACCKGSCLTGSFCWVFALIALLLLRLGLRIC
jgi:hypothetical protein